MPPIKCYWTEFICFQKYFLNNKLCITIIVLSYIHVPWLPVVATMCLVRCILKPSGDLQEMVRWSLSPAAPCHFPSLVPDTSNLCNLNTLDNTSSGVTVESSGMCHTDCIKYFKPHPHLLIVNTINF